MEQTEELPNTVEALYARGGKLLRVLRPLAEQIESAKTKKEKRRIRDRMMPSYELLQAIKRKVKDLEQSATEVDHNAGSPTNENKEEAPAASPEPDSSAVPPKSDAIDASAKPDSPAMPPEPILADATAETDFSAVDPEPTFADAPTSTSLPPWINSKITPKEPKKHAPNDHAVFRFIADGKVHCFGGLDRTVKDAAVLVLPQVKIPRTEPPCYVIRVKFPRGQNSNPSKAQFADPKFHTVNYNFLHGAYTVEDHIVTDAAEFEDFMLHAPEHIHAKAKEAMSQRKFYRITLSFEDDKIEQDFYPNVYSSSVPEIQAIFDAMALVRTAKTISVFQWMYEDLPANLQSLYIAQREHYSRLQPYLHKHQMGLAAYVQWGKIIIPDLEEAFDLLRTFHLYSDYNLIVANAVAREKLKEVGIIKDVRNNLVKMTITQAGPDNRFYIAFLQFRDFNEARKIIIGAGKGLITWEKAPIVKPQSELAQGERPARDKPHGWQAWVITDSTLQHGADIMVLLQRPTNPLNKYYKKAMPAPAKEGDVLQSQLVYYKIRENVATTKQLIDGLNKLRPGETKGSTDAQIKRAILCGRDKTKYRMVDIFDGLSDADIANFARSLTPSQHEFIFSYCRQIFNGVGLLQGPAGSGKTTIIKVLLEIAIKRGLKVAIVTESNSAADNVIEVIADKAYIAVRLHSLGLERRHLTKHARKGAQNPLLPADPEPASASGPDYEHEIPYIDASNYADTGAEDVEAGSLDDSNEDKEDNNREDVEDNDEEVDASTSTVDDPEHPEEVDGWKNDELSINFSDLMIKAAHLNYLNAKKIMSPDDPRMKIIDSALWTYILKVLDKIPRDEDAEVVNGIFQELSQKSDWKELRALVLKSEQQELNQAEWTEYGKLIKKCAIMLLAEGAHTVVCTIAQFAKDWSKNIQFDWIFVDEGTKMTEAQLATIWRDLTDLIMIMGDHAQLGPTLLSKLPENPFVKQLAMSPFARFVETGHPYYMLKEVMRATAGLEAICSDIFYEGQLKPGHRTSLQDRPMSVSWQKQIHLRYPSLKAEPQELVYPVFLNMTSSSEAEISGGTSRINSYNVAAVVEHVIWVVCDVKLAEPGDIGIATPYAGQVNYSRDVLRKVENDEPGYDWSALRIGTTEWFQGREAPYLIIDLVRASNDHGELGFMSEGRRLNVLLSRQKQALVICGDKDCVKPIVTGFEKEDAMVAKRLNEQNKYLIKIFAWLGKKGRSVDVPTDSLPNNYVQLKAIEAPNNDDEDDQAHTSAQTDSDNVPPPSGQTDWGAVPPTGDGWNREEPGTTTDNAWK